MFTARIFNIDPELESLKYILINRLVELKNELMQSKLPAKQLIIDDIKIVLDAIAVNKPASREAVISAARLDKLDDSPRILKYFLSHDTKISRDDLILITKINPAVSKLLTIREQGLVERLRAKL